MSIRCVTPCKLLSLDRESFTRILGSIKQNLAKDYNNEFQTRMLDMQNKRTNSETLQNNFVELDDVLKNDKNSCKTMLLQNNFRTTPPMDSSSGLGSFGK